MCIFLLSVYYATRINELVQILPAPSFWVVLIYLKYYSNSIGSERLILDLLL